MIAAAPKKRIIMENIQIFNDTRELLAVCNGPFKGSKKWKGKEDSHDENEKFCGTKTFEEAANLLVNGDFENAKELGKAVAVTAQRQQSTTNRMSTAPMGFSPCVPNFLQGLPNNMLSFEKRATAAAKKPLKIFVVADYRYTVPQSTIIEVGAAISNAIYSLELSGFRCELYAGSLYFPSSCKKPEKGSYFVKIKSAGAPLNLVKIAFPLMHPSFLRRISFSVCEKTATKYDETYGGCSCYTLVDLGGGVNAINLDACIGFPVSRFVSLIQKANNVL